MKILAIRGRNLASLAQPFEVDFTREPLASAGLFAIVGATGAGKSTLLDALCLALYEETPRLYRRSGAPIPDVQDQAVTQQDVRNLLRRGATDGYAEVDFEGNDGCAYRARWSVRRAYGRSDGKLQKTEMSLVKLVDNQHIGSTASEVKAEIQQRIGLSFEQFTRAVLLAQNEFAAFLKANDNERGELLETLTGTDIYSDISRRAFERHKLEKSALDQLRQRLAEQNPLSAEERARVEEESRVAAAQAAALEQRQAALEADLRWYRTWDEARRREQQAHDGWQNALETQRQSAPRREALERTEAVQPARALVADAERSANEIEQARLLIAQRNAACATAAAARDDAKAALDAARQACEQAERAQTQAVPDLDRAKALDAQIEAMLPHYRQLAAARGEADSAHRQALVALAQKEGARQSVAEQLQADERWLEQNAGLRALAENWQRCDTLLQQAADCARQQAGLERSAGSARQAGDNAKAEAQAAAMRLADAGQGLDDARRALDQASAALARYDAQALAQQRRALESRRDAVLSAARLWHKLDGDLTLQANRMEAAGDLRAAIAGSQALLKHAEEQLPDLDAAVARADKALRDAQLACSTDVKRLRAALQPDAACPVCGASEHPYAHDSSLAETLFATLEEQLGEQLEDCRRRQQAAFAQRTEHAARIAHCSAQLDIVERELAALDAAIAAQRQSWSQHALATELAALPPAGLNAWFDAQTAGIRAQLEEVARIEDECRAAARAREEAQKRFDLALSAHASLKDEALAASARAEKADADLRAALDKHAAVAAMLANRLAELEPSFAGDADWKLRWQADPGEFHRRMEEAAASWRERCAEKDRLAVELRTLNVECASCRERVEAAALELRRAGEAWTQCDADLHDRRKARQALFSGRPVATVEEEFDAALRKARADVAQRDTLHQEALALVERANEALHHAKEQLDAHEKAAQRASDALEAWIAGFNGRNPQPMDAAQLRTLLAQPPEWMEEERRALREIDTRVHTCATVLAERRSQRERHEQVRPATPDAEAATEALQALVAERETWSRRATELQVALTQDDERRRRAAALLADIESQEQRYRTWAQLAELIASQDGKRFRNYAQQFTLDVLLGYANRQLAMLSRRYRLERIPDTLALMVIDQDMGEERRSVHSLSGGECFLVSLALALGLASLSSNRVRVESLFIDEGFGSLDADTLSVAMDALDALHAQGRRVGVISHVQEMTERIATQIRVTRASGGHSSISVVGA